MPRASSEKFKALQELANRQSGYFSNKQADKIGYKSNHVTYHTQQGAWRHVDHGIYRFPGYADNRQAELTFCNLWGQDRAGKSVGVFSHETALQYYGINNTKAEIINLTVPVKFRKKPPEGVSLYKRDLDKTDVLTSKDGYRVTTFQKTIEDMAEDGAGRELLKSWAHVGIQKEIGRASCRERV